ncbi:class I SAM-dependent RNA methyltransferase [Microbacterium protaetiae]|uniref:Class I SAM-dependent RNA methyltransferase n=1 Tax=Microbacterium protaetiae TaxID=2509458 RepID=A0A4P6EHC0_9MICO|nr:TRAM domain-containing protein [Microbacterium protaetiae]QAY60589.1 class I SAM-dependent RNA methyltransferase [Microbacterium protaetiae]
MQPGDHIELDITSVAHGGVFVGRHEGRVVFVPDAIPGERVRVRLTQTGEKSFWRGETVEVMDASPHRRAHVWPQADVDVAPEQRPGGADFGHIELAHQRALKLEVLQDALTRMGGLDLPARMVPIAGDDGTRWRTRVSLHVDDAGRVGPYAARSHRVIPVDDLPLATEAIAAAADDLSADAPGRIDLVEPADGRVRVLPRPTREHNPARDRRARRDAGKGAQPPRLRRNPAREVVVEQVGDRRFQVDAGGFWQVHRLAAATLTDLVTAALPEVDPEGLHLDLYGGVGLFAAALADAGATRIVSVESDSRATEHAGENLAAWIGARAETGRVDRWLPQLRQSAGERDLARLRRGVVVLDPPRSGAGTEVVRELAALAPASIVYVACDPVALARDLKTFRESGYEAAEVTAVDLFPNSHHVEAVTALHRIAE